MEERRQRLLVAAGRAAEALRERWPVLQGVWLFGSALEAGGFRRHSDPDLVVEERKLAALVDSLAALGVVAGDRLRVDAAALRLQSLYTGIERCFLQVSRVLHGGTPDGQDWHRRLLERMGQPTEERPAVATPGSSQRPSLGAQELSVSSIWSKVWAMAAASCPARDGWWK